MLARIEQPDCWAALKSIGAEGVEAVVADDLSLPGLKHRDENVKYTAADAAGVERVLADARTAGVRVTAFCMFNRFAERPDFEVEWGLRVAIAAKTLGVPAVRIDVVPGKLERKRISTWSSPRSRRSWRPRPTRACASASRTTATRPTTPSSSRALFDGVGSDRLGLTLDTGNFYWFGHPLSKLYELYERFAARAFHTHCKSISYPEDDREQAAADRLEVRQVQLPDLRGRHRLRPRRGDSQEGRLHRRPLHRERVAQETQAGRSHGNAA